ncbi:PadR family transcriptional regulator [Thermoactinospora rubra]|uniref:PadR family transcriptional regulator n=1 Tax=Thermoactinospora rubra TaxID=1088767 RepID=UPI000A0F9DBB|nr:PadR family transcriptional regulator [Thermoactinospora rubra]
MARRPNLVGLTVLAMLSVRASHPYELHRFIVDTHKDYVTGLPRSLYHAVERLAKEELIVPVETSREGRRPERTVYEITDEGRRELRTRLRELLERPDPDRRAFVAAISLIGCLPAAEAVRALRARTATLEGRIAGFEAHVRELRERDLPDVLWLEVDYERALAVTELDWLRGLVARAEKGELDWPGTVRAELLERVLE